jgi:hypothetical protein
MRFQKLIFIVLFLIPAISFAKEVDKTTAQKVAINYINEVTKSDNLFHNYYVNTSVIGNFTSSINGLTEKKTYYVRAYATNSVNTGYGEQKQFTTTDNVFTDLRDGHEYAYLVFGTQLLVVRNTLIHKLERVRKLWVML